MKLGQFVKDLKFRTVSRIQAVKYGKTDFGIVKVAFMVAALDGEVTDAELRALDALMRKCRGYSPRTAQKAKDEAMRSAGYLLLLGRRSRDAALVKAFVAEARAALPNGFAYLSVEEVRRAVVTWIALGMSDGDYSARERKCIEALRMHFARMKVRRLEVEEERRLYALAPAFRQACGPRAPNELAKFVPPVFAKRVEELVAQYGDNADAAKELEKLITAPLA